VTNITKKSFLELSKNTKNHLAEFSSVNKKNKRQVIKISLNNLGSTTYRIETTQQMKDERHEIRQNNFGQNDRNSKTAISL
jgi:hypothetical protein